MVDRDGVAPRRDRCRSGPANYESAVAGLSAQATVRSTASRSGPLIRPWWSTSTSTTGSTLCTRGRRADDCSMPCRIPRRRRDHRRSGQTAPRPRSAGRPHRRGANPAPRLLARCVGPVVDQHRAVGAGGHDAHLEPAGLGHGAGVELGALAGRRGWCVRWARPGRFPWSMPTRSTRRLACRAYLIKCLQTSLFGAGEAGV